jgi:hypothetical protein
MFSARLPNSEKHKNMPVPIMPLVCNADVPVPLNSLYIAHFNAQKDDIAH